MPDPIIVEETFQKLVEELESVDSIRQRSLLIREFLLSLEGNYRKFESYVIEVIQFWPPFSGPITYSGMSPDDIEEDLKLLDEVSSSTTIENQQLNYERVTVRLREVLVVLYLFVGEIEYALKWIGLKDQKVVDQMLTGEGAEKLGTTRQLLEDFKNLLSREAEGGWKKGKGLKTDRIVQDLDYILRGSKENEVLVPVVETFESTEGEEKVYGRLRRLKVTVNGETNLERDHIVRRYNVVGVEKPMWLEDLSVSLAARKLLEQFSPGKVINNYKGEIYYEFSGALHQGNSSNAATAALWFTGLQNKSDLRERYQLNRDVVITGNIDENGTLLPVSENSIRAKICAAYFSWATTVIAPASQAELFRRELEELRKTYPRKQLTLFSTESLYELFYDRRISTHLNPSKVRYAAGRMWDKKFETAGLGMVLVLSMIVFRLVYGPVDKNPVLYEFKGEILRVLNQGGTFIEEIHVGEATVRGVESIYRYDIVDFTDVTGNGVNEIIWGELSPNSTGKVSMKEVNKYAKSWEKEIHYNLTYPNKPYVFESNYKPRKIVAGDLNNNGEINLLINSSHSPYFPSVLSLRNALTGEEISHFVHPGRILDFTLLDMTGDGRLEVVICGINNAYDQAFLAILDIDNIRDFGPSTEEYSLEGYATADMLSYILFPKTKVANSITTNVPYNQAERVHFIEDYGLLQVFISDFQNYDGNNEFQRIERAPIYVYMNEDLSIHGIGTSDEYDMTAEYLFNNGIIDRFPDHEYFKEYQRSFLYWNGEEFIKNEENLDLLNLNSSER